MSELVTLAVEDAQVTDAGLKIFEKLPKLEDIDVMRCSSVSDDCCKSMKGLAHLRRLTLRDIPISGAGLAQLQAATGLEMLNLAETQADDNAMQYIVGFPKLQTLNLWHTQITNAGLKHIEALKNLKVLNLMDTEIGDPAWSTSAN